MADDFAAFGIDEYGGLLEEEEVAGGRLLITPKSARSTRSGKSPAR